MYCNKTASYTLLDEITNRAILPVALAVGWIVQVINLMVLQHPTLSRLRYNTYLRLQSVIYLINGIVLIPAILRKNDLVPARQIYSLAFYHAHIEKASINFFIFYGNIITIGIGLQPLYALLFPFRAMQQSSNSMNSGRNRTKLAAMFLGVGLLVLLVVLPVCFMKVVISTEIASQLSNATVTRFEYCISYVRKPWVQHVRYIEAVMFELLAIAIILVTYSWLFVKYLNVQRSHQASLGATTSIASSTSRMDKLNSVNPSRTATVKYQRRPSVQKENVSTFTNQEQTQRQCDQNLELPLVEISPLNCGTSEPSTSCEKNDILSDGNKLKQSSCRHRVMPQTAIGNKSILKTRRRSINITAVDECALRPNSDTKCLVISKTFHDNTVQADSYECLSDKSSKHTTLLSTMSNCVLEVASSDKIVSLHNKNRSMDCFEIQRTKPTKLILPKSLTFVKVSKRREGSDSCRFNGRNSTISSIHSYPLQPGGSSVDKIGSSAQSFNRRHQKATSLCLGAITAFLICNLPSGLLELTYLVASFSGWLPAFLKSPASNVWKNVANVMLVFNLTFTFVTQLLACELYRKGLYSLFNQWTSKLKSLKRPSRRINNGTLLNTEYEQT